MFTSARIKLAAVTGLSAVALIAAGCSSDDSGSTTPGMSHDSTTSTSAATRTDFNNADVTFLQMMYPHHAQAVEMAKLVPTRSQNQQLITLAKSVEDAQAPEMRQFSTLLVSFGKPVPTDGGHGGHGGMQGMMSPEQMTALEQASGAAFDKKWMDMMIEHHQGAIAMANTELAQGVNPDAKALAQSIVTAQQTEIDHMRTMLSQS